ncbi:MAG: UDP-N-acetylmuramoyl-L-alanyl-D-glutamate--2,6-diaminopimelate ligase [Pseudomonadota bacterium]
MMAQSSPVPGYPLQKLLQGLIDAAIPASCAICGITLDSRKVRPGDLFIALGGSREHGAAYIAQAIERGAVAVLVDGQSGDVSAAVPLVAVTGLRAKVGHIAARFFGEPSRVMVMYGITGTNGKTSVSQFIAQALSVDAPCGVNGTLGSGIYGALHSTGHTTPDAVTLQAELAAQQAAGASAAVMEVSSHALDQQRVAGVAFDVAVYTNLSHEHLDYHGDMAAYALAKRRLFQCEGLKSAVLNLDDAIGGQWFAELQGQLDCIGYGFGTLAHQVEGKVLRGSELQLCPVGLTFTVSSSWGEARIATALLGEFNAANLLAALGALLAGGMSFDTAVQRLKQVRTVPGRMERFGTVHQPTVVVDYAHTPDALEQVLQALRGHCAGTLWCVFGCGGDRDRAKRPLMGQLAEALADRVVLTDDNPRSENPWDIIEDIQRGMKEPDAAYVMRDRAAAIGHAIGMAEAGDIVLVAGKGHETEQLIAGRVLPFSDREEVARCLRERGDA